MKLIISCYSCSPSRGSEPGMGWGYLRTVSKYHDVWALVEGYEFGEELRKYQTEHAEEMKRVHFIFIPCKPHPILRKLWPPSYYWFYKAWHKKAYSEARRLHDVINFDAAWKLSMVTYREPGFLWNLPIPFIWGPVGALGYTDSRLFPLLGIRGALEYRVRNLINWWQSRFLIRPRRAALKAALTHTLFAATGENAREMKMLWGVDSQVLCEIGLQQIPSLEMNPQSTVLNIFWSGLFERRKALSLLLRALPMVRGPWRLHVLGDGPCAREWKDLAENLGLADRVIWYGWQKRAAALDVLRSSDIAVITSLHDLTSTVLVEAIAYGKPVVCLDHCGFADVVDDTCGIKIQIDVPDRLVVAFSEALNRFQDLPFRVALSHGAVKRAMNYTWAVKERVLLTILQRVVNYA